MRFFAACKACTLQDSGILRASLYLPIHRVEDRPRGPFFVGARGDHQVVEVRIVPCLAVVLLQVLDALFIHNADALLGVDALVQAAAQAPQAIQIGSIDEDVINVGLVLQDALRAAAHDHAIALAVRLFDDFAGDFHHLFGIEDGVLAEFQAGSQGGRAHGLMIDAPQPGIHVLIVGPHHFGIHMRRVGDGVNDVAVQQLPAEPLGNGLRNASAAAAKLPIDCQYAVIHLTLPQSFNSLRYTPMSVLSSVARTAGTRLPYTGCVRRRACTHCARRAFQEGPIKRIGILFGGENSFPGALVEQINARNIDGIQAEFVLTGAVRIDRPPRYAVIVDRVSHAVPFYRAFLKHAALHGTVVINNPFWASADDKFFNYALALKLGVAVPPTVILPHKQLPAGATDRTMRKQ